LVSALSIGGIALKENKRFELSAATNTSGGSATAGYKAWSL
jgi:hypothetical protein